jgi:hypothetical protein
MMFRKIFSKQMKRWQRILVLVSSFVGLLLIWISLALYFDISKALSETERLFGDQYLVLNKRVSVFGALGMGRSGFSIEEIKSVEELKGVTDVGEFVSNRFRANAIADFGDMGPLLKTELFFESVPDRFLDTKPAGWKWRPSDPDVPIIVPSDYLALYNFGFAPGQDLPQISESVAKMSAFKISIETPTGPQIFNARIGGFSDRINTILAPLSFLEYANEQFGLGQREAPQRIIVASDDISALEKLMGEKGYETSDEKMQMGKEKLIAQRILSIGLVLGFFIVILSLGSFLQMTDLLIARSDQEIRTLGYLGYTYSQLSKKIFAQIIRVIAISFLLAFAGGIVLRWKLSAFLAVLVGEQNMIPSSLAIVILFAIVLSYAALVYWNILRQTKRMLA